VLDLFQNIVHDLIALSRLELLLHSAKRHANDVAVMDL